MDRVRQLIRRKIPDGELASYSLKIGRNHAYLFQFLRQGVPRKLPEEVRERLAPLIGEKPDALRLDGIRPMDGEHLDGPRRHESSPQPPVDNSTEEGTTAVLPSVDIYGTTERIGGTLLMSPDPVDACDRPLVLAHVKDAYGIIMRGDHMVPAARPGHYLLIHPHAPPKLDDLCVFRGPKPPIGKEWPIEVREFVADEGRAWRVRQFNPPKESTLSKADWPECHVVYFINRRP